MSDSPSFRVVFVFRKAGTVRQTITGGMGYGGQNSVLDLLESILSLTALKIGPYETVCLTVLEEGL